MLAPRGAPASVPMAEAVEWGRLPGGERGGSHCLLSNSDKGAHLHSTPHNGWWAVGYGSA